MMLEAGDPLRRGGGTMFATPRQTNFINAFKQMI